MQIAFDHNIFYGTTIEVPLPEIARSLLATEQAVKRLPPILEKMFPGLHIESIAVDLKKAESGSLIEDFVLKIVCDYQKDIEQAIHDKGQEWGIEVLERKKVLISYIIIALLLMGAGYAISLVTPSEGGVHITGDRNVVINAAGDISGISPEQIKTILESSTPAEKDKRKLAKEAVDFFAPAKIEPNVKITSGSDIVISPEAVKEVPTRQQIEEIEDDEFQREFNDVEVDIRVIDRDQGDHGWKAVIDALGKRRVKLMLSPTINIKRFAEVATKGPVTGDVVVEFVRLPSGEDRPVLIHLISVKGIE